MTDTVDAPPMSLWYSPFHFIPVNLKQAPAPPSPGAFSQPTYTGQARRARGLVLCDNRWDLEDKYQFPRPLGDITQDVFCPISQSSPVGLSSGAHEVTVKKCTIFGYLPFHASPLGASFDHLSDKLLALKSWTRCLLGKHNPRPYLTTRTQYLYSQHSLIVTKCDCINRMHDDSLLQHYLINYTYHFPTGLENRVNCICIYTHMHTHNLILNVLWIEEVFWSVRLS